VGGLKRQFANRQAKVLAGCYFRWDEIYHQRITVQRGGFGFRPFIRLPTLIKRRKPPRAGKTHHRRPGGSREQGKRHHR